MRKHLKLLSIVKTHWPLIITLALFWSTVAILLAISIQRNEGHFTYVLDDPYIHMAIAKNLAQYGTWGIDKYGFTSSSSSLLWTLLLSLIYFLFGPNIASPLILNFLFGTLVVVLVYTLLRKYKLHPCLILIILLLFIFSSPLPSLIFCGQEHILHALIAIIFVYLSAKILSIKKTTPLEYLLLLLLTPLLSMARYEGLFLLLVVCVLLVIKRRLLYSLLLAGVGILPILGYGIISISNGWYFLPNPVLLKGNIPDLFSLMGIIRFLGYSSCEQMLKNPHILFLVLAALVLFFFQYSKQNDIWKDLRIMIIIFVATTLLHMQFARIGWFYRYEAYLIALGIFVISVAIWEALPARTSAGFDRTLIPKYVAMVILVVLACSPLIKRALLSLTETPQAASNIYQQQYQIAKFLQRFYQGSSIAANDIGAINYFADIQCLDLFGIGSLEIAKAKLKRAYDTEKMYKLAHQKKVAVCIVYDHWFDVYGGIPSQWIKVGQWKISNNVVCGGDTVSFYAVDPNEQKRLCDSLRHFSQNLPQNVAQEGKYINTKEVLSDAKVQSSRIENRS